MNTNSGSARSSGQSSATTSATSIPVRPGILMSRNITSGSQRQRELGGPQAVVGHADDPKLGPHLLQQAGQGARENRFVLGDDGSGWRGQGHADLLDGSMKALGGQRSVRRIRSG